VNNLFRSLGWGRIYFNKNRDRFENLKVQWYANRKKVVIQSSQDNKYIGIGASGLQAVDIPYYWEFVQTGPYSNVGCIKRPGSNSYISVAYFRGSAPNGEAVMVDWCEGMETFGFYPQG
jgi:hypothetical protein